MLKKPISLTSSFMYSVCVCVLPRRAWLLWNDGSFAKRTKESLEKNLFYIYINK